MTKAELRKIYIQKRKALLAEECDLLNQQLLVQFKKLDISDIKCLHIFLPIISRREPATRLIIDWLKETHPQIKIVFPKTNFGDHSMQSFADDGALVLQENTYGITEPVSGTLVDNKEIDMIILPLLAFDKRGYRVGYGKGFYDRFIEKCRADVQLIGLSFFEPVEEIFDVYGFDKKMNWCIMPGKICKF